MGLLLKVIIVFAIVYFVFRRITKPFRDFINQAKKQSKMQSDNLKKTESKPTSKTDNVGEYIDYEEVK